MFVKGYGPGKVYMAARTATNIRKANTYKNIHTKLTNTHRKANTQEGQQLQKPTQSLPTAIGKLTHRKANTYKSLHKAYKQA